VDYFQKEVDELLTKVIYGYASSFIHHLFVSKYDHRTKRICKRHVHFGAPDAVKTVDKQM
jgi:hypothetical protein